MAYLVLVRHGESEWNAKGLWTGFKDIPLSPKGHKEAREAGRLTQDISFDIAFTSPLIRAKQTLDEIKQVLKASALPTIESSALNERNYGVYTGKNKWEIKKEIGDEKFRQIRRGWDVPIEKGESLKDVFERVIPYYQSQILPKIKNGKNVLISAHGNSLRSLIKYLDNISDDEIPNLEMATGEVWVYKFDSSGKIINKEIRS